MKKLSKQEIAILSALKDIPPKNLLIECYTQDQREYWCNLKAHYTTLTALLREYFSGGSYKDKLNSITKLNSMNNDFSALWKAKMNMYLKLYDLIQEEWTNIKEAFLECEIVFNNPGHLFTTILESEAVFEFIRCTNNAPNFLTRFSPKYLYSRVKNIHNKTLTSIEMNNINAIISLNPYKFACLAVAHKSKLKDIKKLLREYETLHEEVYRLYFSQIHPSKKPTGHQWVDGHRLPIANKAA